MAGLPSGGHRGREASAWHEVSPSFVRSLGALTRGPPREGLHVCWSISRVAQRRCSMGTRSNRAFQFQSRWSGRRPSRVLVRRPRGGGAARLHPWQPRNGPFARANARCRPEWSSGVCPRVAWSRAIAQVSVR